MKDAHAPKSLLTRIRRRAGFDRNPLRRRIDRAEMIIIMGLLTAFAVGAPLVAMAAGHQTDAIGKRALHEQLEWRRVPAVLLQPAPANTSAVYQGAAVVWIRARWTAADGSAHTGEVPAHAGDKKGSTVRIWVDRTGHVAGVPLTRGQIADRVVAVAVFAPFALAIVLLLVAAFAERLLDRRRIASWGNEWASIEPQWSRRRQAPGP